MFGGIILFVIKKLLDEIIKLKHVIIEFIQNNSFVAIQIIELTIVKFTRNSKLT